MLMITLILDGSRDSLKACLKTLDDFYKVSGLKLNDKKTEALWMGSKCGSSDIPFPDKNFKWPEIQSRNSRSLAFISPGGNRLNYDEKSEKVRTTLSSSNYRRLKLMGKKAVLKVLLSPNLFMFYHPYF